MEEVKTLSDHLYMGFEVSPPPWKDTERSQNYGMLPRWAVRRLDTELANEAAIV